MRTEKRVILLSLAAVGMTLTACAGGIAASPSQAAIATHPALGPFQADLVSGLRTETDIAYTDVTDCGGTPCRVPGDVLAPRDGSNLPTVVMLGGGSTPFSERRYQENLAVELAQRGAVVFLLSYRSAVTGNYDSDTSNDIRCAVRFARAETETYGGDPNRVVLSAIRRVASWRSRSPSSRRRRPKPAWRMAAASPMASSPLAVRAHRSGTRVTRLPDVALLGR